MRISEANSGPNRCRVDLEGEDLTTVETIACAFTDFPDHFGFFLPLAEEKAASENAADRGNLDEQCEEGDTNADTGLEDQDVDTGGLGNPEPESESDAERQSGHDEPFDSDSGESDSGPVPDGSDLAGGVDGDSARDTIDPTAERAGVKDHRLTPEASLGGM